MQDEEKVIYLSKEWLPDNETEVWLINMQNRLSQTYRDIYREEKDNPYNRVIRVQTLANILRSKWKLIHNKEFSNSKKES